MNLRFLLITLCIGMLYSPMSQSQELTSTEKLLNAFFEAKGRVPTSSPLRGKKISVTSVDMSDGSLIKQDTKGPIFLLDSQPVDKGPLFDGQQTEYFIKKLNTGYGDLCRVVVAYCTELVIAITQDELIMTNRYSEETTAYRQVNKDEVVSVSKNKGGEIVAIRYYWSRDN